MCESLGHDVVVESPTVHVHERLTDCFDIVWTASIAATIDHWLARRHLGAPGGFVEPLTERLYQRGRSVTAATYVNAVTELQRAARGIAGFSWTTTSSSPPP